MTNQKTKLLTTLKTHHTIFDGHHGDWKGEAVALQLKHNVRHYYAWLFSIPLSQLYATKHEVYCQCDIGTMGQLTGKEAEQNKWAFTAFTVAKKTGEIWLIIDFWKLNQQLERGELLLPTIKEALQSIGRFSYASGIDFSMGYMSLCLDPWDPQNPLHHHVIWPLWMPCVTAGSQAIHQYLSGKDGSIICPHARCGTLSLPGWHIACQRKNIWQASIKPDEKCWTSSQCSQVNLVC